MPDIIDRQRRLDVHLGNRNMALKDTAARIANFLDSDFRQMDYYEVDDLQSEMQLILASPGLKGRALESMINNNHTLTYMIWTNYLIHNKIPIKDTKISEMPMTKKLIAQIEFDIEQIM